MSSSPPWPLQPSAAEPGVRVLCMPQAFKGTLTARAAAAAMAAGVRAAVPDAEVLALPMADGGDDTLDILVHATHGKLLTATVQDPLGRPVQAQWGVLGGAAQTAVIEMATASGLRLLSRAERDPRRASTYGTGQLIRAALDAGYQRIIVGVGGSATVDGGAGAAAALGARFLDAAEAPLPPGGAALLDLARIDLSGVDPRARAADIRVACDVNMTLCGDHGAWSFAAQKGAPPPVAAALARALEHYAAVVQRQLGLPLATLPLGGPAGGLPAGLHACLGARLELGAELVLDLAKLAPAIPTADLLITGEGIMDDTSFRGKGTGALALRAARARIPILAVVGQTPLTPPALQAHGIRMVECLSDYAALAESEAHPAALITRATAQLLRRFLSR